MEKLKTNTWRTLFEPICRHLNNNLGSANVFNVKINEFGLFGAKMGLSCKFRILSP